MIRCYLSAAECAGNGSRDVVIPMEKHRNSGVLREDENEKKENNGVTRNSFCACGSSRERLRQAGKGAGQRKSSVFV